MKETSRYCIGDIEIELIVDSMREYTNSGRFPEFQSRGSQHAVYNIVYQQDLEIPDGLPIVDTQSGWKLYQTANHWILWIQVPGFEPYLMANLSHDFHSGVICTTISRNHPGKWVFPLDFPLGRLLYTSLLSTGYGVLLHACGLVDSNRGIVFAGFGGAGKTTTGNLWNGLPGVRVLSDDQVIVRKINGKYIVFGTPWYSKSGSCMSSDGLLTEIFIIKHSSFNEIKRITPARAAAELLVRSFAPYWNADGMAFTLEFLGDLCESIPVYEYGFKPDNSAVEYIRCLNSG